MTQSPARATRRPIPTPLGSPLIRLLATLDGAPVPASKDAFAERLSRWFEWRDAIALSGVLNAANPLVAAPAGVSADSAGHARRVRAALDRLADSVSPINGSPTRAHAAAHRSGGPGRPPPTDLPATNALPAHSDFASHRRRYLDAQRDMSTQITALRGRLRQALSDQSPAMARLAALDAVMERVVGEHEHVLLATVPRWLQAHHQRLCREVDRPPSGARSDTEPPTEPHIEANIEATTAVSAPAAAAADHASRQFLHDLRAVLRAELDLRWQPIDGLLEALRRDPDVSP